jgi:two-component system LytT family sensor kinase
MSTYLMRNYWICQFAGWGIVCMSMLVYANTFASGRINNAFYIKLVLIFFTGVFSSHLLRFYIRRRKLLHLPFEKATWKLLAGIIVTSWFCVFLQIGLMRIFNLKPELTQNANLFSKMFASALTFGLYLTPWVLIYCAWHYIIIARKKEQETFKLENLLKDLEIKAIQSTINPGFIFNTLLSIQKLIEEDSERARAAVTELSNILRFGLQSGKKETISFSKELDNVNDYLALENIRFDGTILLDYSIDEETLDLALPPMMLQGMVENAINDFARQLAEVKHIKIISSFNQSFHELKVQHTGSLEASNIAELLNVEKNRNHLNMIFGASADCRVYQYNDQVIETVVVIPLEK